MNGVRQPWVLSGQYFSHLSGGGGLCTIFFSPWVGKMADRYGKHRIFTLFALCSLVPIWFITHLQPSPLWMALIITGLFFIFTNGRTIPMQTIVSGVIMPQQRGGFTRINSALQQLAAGLAAYVGGAIIYKTADGYIHRYDWVGVLSIVLILLCILLARRVKTIEQAGRPSGALILLPLSNKFKSSRKHAIHYII